MKMTRWFTQVLGYVKLINANIRTGAQEGEISALWLSTEGGGGMELRCACVCVRVRGGGWVVCTLTGAETAKRLVSVKEEV